MFCAGFDLTALAKMDTSISSLVREPVQDIAAPMVSLAVMIQSCFVQLLRADCKTGLVDSSLLMHGKCLGSKWQHIH